ncbi:MAG: hypothetical protein HQL69_16850 [Magnetococcales bacterium]|nr:hypothetical protein [Magnetococcales bacterium]
MIFLSIFRSSVVLLAILMLHILLVITPSQAEERIDKQVLLSRHISLDLPDLKINGIVNVFTLNPLTGQLIITFADGDPRRIFDLMSESSGLLHGLSNKLPIQHMVLTDCVINLSRKGLDLKFKSADIPAGHIEDVEATVSLNKIWKIKTGKFNLQNFPFSGPEWYELRTKMDIFPLGYESFEASGEQKVGNFEINQIYTKQIRTEKLNIWLEQPKFRQYDISINGEKVRIEDPAKIPDETKLVRQIMAYAGKAAQMGDILNFDKFLVRGVVYNLDSFKINPVRLSAKELQIWGTIDGKSLPKPGSIDIELTAKRPGREEEGFYWNSETKQDVRR